MSVRFRSARVWTLALLALVCTTQLAQAQTGKARAQRLAKLEEDLAADDVNSRLEAFETAMGDPSIIIRNRALDIALASSERNMRGAALVYAVCARQDLPMRYPDISTGNGFFQSLTGMTAVPIAGCSVETGTFRTVPIPGRNERPEISPDSLVGQVSGTRLTFRFVIADDNICEFSGTLGQGATVGGSLNCIEERRKSSGAVQATIELR